MKPNPLPTLLLLLLANLSTAHAQIEHIAVTDTEILLKLSPTQEPVSLHSAFLFEDDTTALTRSPVWTGVVTNEPVHLPRFDDHTDRLYHRFLLRNAAGDQVGNARFVTDLSALTRSNVTLPQPTSPKGLQCVVDIDDAIALGVKHTAVNVSLGQLYDASGNSEIRRHVDGETVTVNPHALARLDDQVRRMTAAGMRVNLILLNYLPPGDRTSPLVHPKTDPKPPNNIGGFNLTDEAGYRVFRGLVEILAERYSRPDAAHGLVSGYIVGNEVQSHFDWYNLGDMQPSTVVQEYAKAVRIADLAVRRFHSDARVFISLDHNWTRQHRAELTRSLPGRDFLEQLHASLVAQGDFPWSVAFHPYPENLGDPRTWNDKTAIPSFDTPRITFRNLEVLPAFLQQPQFLIEDEPRRIILSEQGFHCLESPEGPTLQAAAYAYAYQRLSRIEGIESFIYHRHVDHPREGGLHLGLRENVPGTYDRPGQTRAIYDLFRVIDTPEGAAASDFALPIIGIDKWDDVKVNPIESEKP